MIVNLDMPEVVIEPRKATGRRRHRIDVQGEADQAVRDELAKQTAFHNGLQELLARCGGDKEAILQGVVDLLPDVCRYSEICAARLVFGDRTFATRNWRDAPWKKSADMPVHGRSAGTLEVVYLESRAFTVAECALVRMMAIVLGKTVERLGALGELSDTVRQLELERASLQETNSALHVILGRIEADRKEIRRSIMLNVDNVIMPMVRSLEASVEPRDRRIVELLRKNLEEIASPFVDRISRAFTNLTPLEVSLCRMICDNLTSKEIARIRHVATATVARQRESIRRKLGIAGSETNLATYLRTFLGESAQK
jgi:DNA-binding NarL/FixJ family response regulator